MEAHGILRLMKARFISKRNLAFLFASILYFGITLYTDRFIFYDTVYMKRPLYFLFKILILGGFIALSQVIAQIVQWICSGSAEARSFLKYFMVYFGVMCLVLLVTWPGAWRGDEFIILEAARKVEPRFWHHWLTSAYYLIFMTMLPFPGGMVFCQILLISAFASLIVIYANKIYPISKPCLYMVPLFFPSVIDQNIYLLRMSLVGFLQLFLFLLLLYWCRAKNRITVGGACALALLTSLVACWRSETIFYILIIPLIAFLFLRRHMERKVILCFFGAVILCTGVFMGGQKLGEYVGSKPMEYKLTAYLSPLSRILKTDFRSDAPEQDLAVIDRVIPVKYLLEMDGVTAYHTYGANDYTEQDAKEFEQVYVRLVCNNIPVYLENQFFKFSRASAFNTHASNAIGNTAELFGNPATAYIERFQQEYILNRPVSLNLRKYLIHILEGKSFEDYFKPTWIYYVFYNIIPPILLNLALCVYGLIKRNWPLFLLFGGTFAQSALIFATAPAGLFFYYYPVYLIGYLVVPVIFLAELRGKRYEHTTEIVGSPGC